VEKQRIEREEKRVEGEKTVEPVPQKEASSLLPPIVDELVKAEETREETSPILTDPLKDFIIFAKHLGSDQKKEPKPSSFLESYGKIYSALHLLSEKVNEHYKKYNQVMEGKEEFKRLLAQQPDKYDALAEKLNLWVEKVNALIDEYNEGVFISEQVVAHVKPLFSESPSDAESPLAKRLPLFPFSQEEETLFSSVLFEPVAAPCNYTAIFEELSKKGALPQLSALVPLLSMERWHQELIGIEEEYFRYLDGLISYGFFSLDLDKEILSNQLAKSPYLIHSVYKVVESAAQGIEGVQGEAIRQKIAHRLNIQMEEALSSLMFTSVEKSVEYFSRHQEVKQEKAKRIVASLFFIENMAELVRSKEWKERLFDAFDELPSSAKASFSGIEQSATLSLMAVGIQLMAIESGLKGLAYSFTEAVTGSMTAPFILEEHNKWAEGSRIFETMKPLFSSEKQTLFCRAIFQQPKFWVSEFAQKEAAYKLGIKENIPSYRLERFLEASRVFASSAVPSYEFIEFSPEMKEVEGAIVKAAKEVAQHLGQSPALAVIVVEALIEKVLDGLTWTELKEQSRAIVEQYPSVELTVDKELLYRLTEVIHLHYPFLLQKQVFQLHGHYLASRFISLLKSTLFEKENLEDSSDLTQLEEQLTLRFQDAVENKMLSLPIAWEKRVAHLLDLFLFSPVEKRGDVKKALVSFSDFLGFLTPLQEYVNTLTVKESASSSEILTALIRRYFPESLGHFSVHHLTGILEQTSKEMIEKAKKSTSVRKQFVKAVKKALYMPSSWYKRTHFLYSIAFFLEGRLEKEERKLLFDLAGDLQTGVLELQKGLQTDPFLWPAAIAFKKEQESAFIQLMINSAQETPYFDLRALKQALLTSLGEDQVFSQILPSFFYKEQREVDDYLLLAMNEAQSIQEAQKDWELFSFFLDEKELDRRSGLVKEQENLFTVLWLEEELVSQGLSEQLSEAYATLPQINLFAAPFFLAEKTEDTEEIRFPLILGHTTFKGYLEKILVRYLRAKKISLRERAVLAKQISDEVLSQTGRFGSFSDFKQVLLEAVERVIFLSEQPIEIKKVFVKEELKALVESVRITVPLRQEIMQKELEVGLLSSGIPFHKLESKCFEVVRAVFKIPFAFADLEAFRNVLETMLAEKGLIASEFVREKLLTMQFGFVLRGDKTLKEFEFSSPSLQETARVFQSELAEALEPALKEEAKSFSKQASEIIFGYQEELRGLAQNPFSFHEQIKQILEHFALEIRKKTLKSAVDGVVFVSAPKFLMLKNLLLPNELLIRQSELQREEDRENRHAETNRI